MKKTILTIALLAAALGAQAASQPTHAVAGAATVAAAAAVAVPGAGPAAPVAAVAAAAAAAAAPAAAEQATVSVTGASTVAGAPLLLAIDGAKAVDPTFQQLFQAGLAHPQWKVTQVKTQGDKSRMFLKSATGKATIEMDVATTLVRDLKIKKDAVISVEAQSSGQGALIKFMKDKTPLGFMVNQNTAVVQPHVG